MQNQLVPKSIFNGGGDMHMHRASRHRTSNIGLWVPGVVGSFWLSEGMARMSFEVAGGVSRAWVSVFVGVGCEADWVP